MPRFPKLSPDDTSATIQPPPIVPLYGTMQGVFYDTRHRSTTSGQDLASILRNPPSRPHPITARTDRGLDDLHVSPSVLCDGTSPASTVDESKLEILCRCNGQRLWVSGKGMKDHICQNTGVGEAREYLPAAGSTSREGFSEFEPGV